MNLLSDLLKNSLIFQCIFVMIFVNSGIAQSCLEGNHLFSTQAQLDQFKSENPNCTKIAGNIVIEEAISNLNAFSKIKTIDGILQIRNCNELTDLGGLEKLEEIGGDLFLYENKSIRNFEALKSIQSIGGLKIDVNPAFENFKGLEKITSIDGVLFINANEKLGSFEGLENLKNVGSAINIRYNNKLINFNGLNSLETAASLEIVYNDALINLDGLQMLKTNEGNLLINYNDKLKNVCGLNGLELVGVSFSLFDNANLEHVDALSNLKKVGKFLTIESNNKLTSIQGLENVNHFPIWKLNLKNNPALTACNNTMVCNVIKDGINRDIEDNGANCNTAEMVKQACDVEIISTELETAITYINNKTIIGSKIFEAEFEIESNSFVFFSADVTFKANNAITLNTGFEVKQSADFLAEIGGVEIITEIDNNCN